MAAAAVSHGSFFQRTATLYELAVNNRVSAEMVAESVSVAGATDDVYITMLERNTPQRIRMFIWLEGQDPDCRTLTAESRNFVLNLELAGAN